MLLVKLKKKITVKIQHHEAVLLCFLQSFIYALPSISSKDKIYLAPIREPSVGRKHTVTNHLNSEPERLWVLLCVTFVVLAGFKPLVILGHLLMCVLEIIYMFISGFVCRDW